nr:MAG TPA: hypothetical protein [Caudoviricetes sp.]
MTVIVRIIIRYCNYFENTKYADIVVQVLYLHYCAGLYLWSVRHSLGIA